MGNHMLYVIGAGVIFFTSVLTLNNTMLNNYNTITESNILLTAASVGQGIIEEAQGKLYDGGLLGATLPDVPICFTAAESLGTEGSESYPLFNDVDDYNGLVRSIETETVRCSVVVKVGYVDSNDVNQWINNKGFYKKMEVAVHANGLEHHVTLDYLFCYHK